MDKLQQFEVKKLKFLGEQDGSSECDLKGHLAKLFKLEPSILRAYLAQISYGGSSCTGALCLRSDADLPSSLIENIGKIFAAMFINTQYLDILSLTEQQEIELKRCCRPFFNFKGQNTEANNRLNLH